MTDVLTKTASAPFHVMTKPIGPRCNIDCKYCFYLEKEKLFPRGENLRMPADVLDNYIRQYIEAQPGNEVSFAWQGGEPTLMGVDFFRKVVELQKKYGEGRKIDNAFQTNATLLDDEWCRFLRDNDFLVGISIDGTRELHDIYRVDRKQNSTFDRVMRGIGLCRKHGVPFNTLTCVTRRNSRKPLEVYNFLRKIGSRYLQFIPIVERKPDDAASLLKLSLATPPEPEDENEKLSPVTRWSVLPKDYGEFLVTIFDHWVRNDVGNTYVQVFDVALGNWMGMGGGLCIFSEHCGRALAIEHNGDLYACDHYVYPQYLQGNIRDKTIAEMVDSPAMKKFGRDKADTLPAYCRRCDYRFACHGECPKHRFMKTPDGEYGLNYLCPAYKRFFAHIDPYMKTMRDLLKNRQAPATIMGMLKKGLIRV